MKKNDAKDPVVTSYSEIITMMVPLPVTNERKLEVGDLLAQDENELTALITLNKATNAEFRKERKEIVDRISQRVAVITQGYEETLIECKYRYNFPTVGEKTLYALRDTVLPGDDSPPMKVNIQIRVDEMTEEEKNDMFKN